MIKVIHVITDTNIGGAGRLLVNYLKNFNRDEFDIKVILPKGSMLTPEIKNVGYEAIETNGGADKSLDVAAIGEFKKIFKREKPDIVHTHSSMSAKIAAFMAGVPVRMYTRHCTYDPPKYMTVFPFKQINGAINMTLCPRIIAVAESAKKNLTDTGIKAERVDVIMNGVEELKPISDEEKRRVKNSYGIGDEFVVGIVARLEDVKGHEYFIDAAAKVIKSGRRAKFLIIGTGTQEQALKQKAKRLEIEKDVIFTGFINDVTPLVNIMDLNINCSYGTETSSLALSEGFSLGKPAIASVYGGNPYMVTEGENGFLTPIKESDELTKRIMEIMDDKQLYARLSKRARELYEQKFTARHMTRQLEDIYRQEVKKHEN